MDIEVSFFTFDRLETLSDTKSKKKKKRKFKEKIRRRIECREDIFLKIFGSSTARIPRGTSQCFSRGTKRGLAKDFLVS